MSVVASKPVDQLPAANPNESTAAILSVLERMATSKDIDPERVERFMAMYERMEARNAEKAFASAFAEMQGELPEIPERGKIIIRDKNNRDVILQETPYALWEDINEAIKPILAKHGFALSFRPGQEPDGRVSVTAVLRHSAGHRDEAKMVLQHDGSGSKNAVQAIGSSTSYGKRYAAMALLNITSRGEDDDGQAAGAARSKGESREPYADMQAEIDACATVEDLGLLWKSKAFQAELAKLPKDWQAQITFRKDERKAELSISVDKRASYVPPTFVEEPGDDIPY